MPARKQLPSKSHPLIFTGMTPEQWMKSQEGNGSTNNIPCFVCKRSESDKTVTIGLNDEPRVGDMVLKRVRIQIKSAWVEYLLCVECAMLLSKKWS